MTWKQNMIKNMRDHLKNSSMTYAYHMIHACQYGFRLLWVGVKSIVHGIFPLVWKYDGPREIIKMYKELRRHKHIRKMMDEDKDAS